MSISVVASNLSISREAPPPSYYCEQSSSSTHGHFKLLPLREGLTSKFVYQIKSNQIKPSNIQRATLPRFDDKARSGKEIQENHSEKDAVLQH